MIKLITKKLLYGLLVLAGVIVLVFFLFQGFGDPSRIVMGQTGDSTTQANIRQELSWQTLPWYKFPGATLDICRAKLLDYVC